MRSDCSHLWIVDADVETPHFALEELLFLDVDVASGIYPIHGSPDIMCGGKVGPAPIFKLLFASRENLKGQILGEHELVAGGNGCLLVKRRVVEKYHADAEPIRFRYLPGKRTSDIQFFIDCQERGFSARVHGDVVCGHLPELSLKTLRSLNRKIVNLSIIVPYYQKAAAFKHTWQSLEPQLAFGDEVIIVDDHSPDGFPFKSHWFHIVKTSETAEHVYRINRNRNIGIGEARNDAILILDPDCLPSPMLLQEARKLFNPAIVHGGRIDYLQLDGSITKDPRLMWNQFGLHDLHSHFVDEFEYGEMAIWGGCILFSKLRTSMIGWFTEKIYDGRWGITENDFANKCYHSGLRLRYASELRVYHQWHQEWREGYSDNRMLFRKRKAQYHTALHDVTPYKPKTLVKVGNIAEGQLSEVLQTVFQHETPVKVSLDFSQIDLRELKFWLGRYCILDSRNVDETKFASVVHVQKPLQKGQLDQLIRESFLVVKP